MKRYISLIFKFFAIVTLPSIYLPVHGQIIETYNTPGTITWTCPANVTQVVVECWGGGGGGGNSANNTINGGAGGGGGAYAKKTFTVVAGNVYYLSVGAGGAGAPASSSTAALSGGDSWFNDFVPYSNAAVLAKGGGGGLNNSTAVPNNGGSSLNSFGDIVYNGGNGYQASSTGGGGGGASASPSANGISAINFNGAVANIGGGNGGNGGNLSSTSSLNGAPGSWPGGGGGGSDDWASRSGGTGGNGKVVITYFINGQIIETYNTTGTITWTCPANVTQVIVECWGGGGGGGNSANNTINGGAGGGGGAYAKKTFTVVAGNVYYLSVGAGGAGAPASSSTPAFSGGDSWFNNVNSVPNSNAAVLAKGGGRGLNNSMAVPNNGGSSLNSFGDIVYNGGNGYQASSTGGGGGGASASSIANGVSAINFNGAIANADGGNGGNGSTSSSVNGAPGSLPGGGGGGSDDWASRSGGTGGNGKVVITYFINCSGTPNTGAVSMSSSNGCEGSSLTLTAANLTTEQGINYQWQISSDNVIWNDISGETSSSYTTTPTSSSYYRIKSVCSFSGLENYSQSVQYTVFQLPTTPVISASGNTTFCQGNSVILSSNVVSGLIYQWQNNGVNITSANSFNYIASSSGTYSLVVTTANGCSASSSSTTVTVNPVPNATVNVSGPTTFCQGGNVVFSVASSTGQTYQWQNNGTNISGATTSSYTANSSGSYSITINNTFGCTSSSNPINVTVSSFPSATIDNQGISLICQGGTVLLSANTGTGLTYQWANNGTNISGATSSSYSSNTAGSYTVIVTNSIGCSTTSNATVLTLNQLTTTIYPINSTMNTGYVTSTGTKISGDILVPSGRGWAKFPLTSIPSGSVITGVTIKFYTYGGTTSNFNQIKSLGGDPVTMTGTSLYGAFMVGNGTIYNTSTWTVGTSTTPSLNTIVLPSAISHVQFALASGWVNFGFINANTNLYGSNNTTYSVRLEISYNPPAPSAPITALSATTFCQGGSVTLYTSNGNGNTFNWKNNGTNILGALSSYVASNSGIYTVQVTNSSGCSTISSPITVSVNPLPVATLSNTGSLTFCQGSSVTLNANIGGFSYQWKKDGVILSGANATSYSATTTGSYSVLITDINGCFANSNSLNVTVNPVPNPIISGITSICDGDSSVLSINPSTGAIYQWRVNGININGATNNSYVLTTPGSYSVNVTNSFGCSAISPSVNIIVNPLPTTSVSSSNTTSFCQGGSTVLSSSNNVGLTYQWFKNGIQINGANSSNYNASTSGNYNVFITDNNGCSNFSSNLISVTVLSLPSLSISGDTSICQGETTTLTASSNGNVTWGNQNQNSIQVSPSNTSTYSVTSTGANGCSVQDQITVQVHYPSDTAIYTSSFGPYILNGVVYNESGVFTQNLQTIFGCDSTITLNLNYITNSIEDLTKLGVTIYPNPSKVNVIYLMKPDKYEIEIEGIQDMYGRQIAFIQNENKVQLMTEAKGVYYLMYKFENNNIHRKNLKFILE